MDKATGQPATKRIRFDTTVKTDNDNQSPLKAAHMQMKAHAVSLRREIQDILLRLGTHYLSKLSSARTKSSKATKMAQDEEYIPGSARIDFRLNTTKESEKAQEFELLSTATNNLVLQFRKDLKKQIIQACELDAKTYRHQAAEALANALFKTTKALLLSKGNTTANPHKLVITILDQHHENILNATQQTHDDFKKIYQEKHQLTELPEPFVTVAMRARRTQQQQQQNNEDSLVLTGHIPNQNVRPPSPVHNPPPPTLPNADESLAVEIYSILTGIYIEPWNVYVRQQQHNERQLALKKFSTEIFTETATTAAQMEIDEETPATRLQLQQLVDEKTKAATESIRRELRSLNQKIDGSKKQKNSPRGQKGTQHTKNKNNNKNNTRKNVPKADNAGKDTSTAPSTKQTRPSKKKSNGKNKNSSNNKRNASKTSRKSSN